MKFIFLFIFVFSMQALAIEFDVAPIDPAMQSVLYKELDMSKKLKKDRLAFLKFSKFETPKLPREKIVSEMKRMLKLYDEDAELVRLYLRDIARATLMKSNGITRPANVFEQKGGLPLFLVKMKVVTSFAILSLNAHLMVHRAHKVRISEEFEHGYTVDTGIEENCEGVSFFGCKFDREMRAIHSDIYKKFESSKELYSSIYEYSFQNAMLSEGKKQSVNILGIIKGTPYLDYLYSEFEDDMGKLSVMEEEALR